MDLMKIEAGSDARGLQTMSSLEIAELTGKRHDHVLRDTDKMLEELEINAPRFGGVYLDSKGEERRCINLPKRETLILVSGYSIELRARIIDRWQELEAKPSPAIDMMAALNDPAILRQTLGNYADRVIALQGEVEEMRPQVQALERIAISDGSLCVTDAAKTLQVQPKALFAFLRSHRWIYSRAGASQEIAYQDKLAAGLLEHKTNTVTRSDGTEKTVSQVRVTVKGLSRLAKEFPPVAKLVA